MTIEEILRRLKVQKHAQAGRDNRCICPCHADRTGSLMVKLESDGRILMHCQAGCSVQDVCKAIGVELADLHEHPLVPGATVHNAKPARKPKPSKPAAPPEPKEDKPERQLPWPPTKVYDYTDEDGQLIFNVLRFTYPEGDKTFRQGIPDPSKRTGYALGGVSKLRKPLYRLPEVIRAIKGGEPVYVVEGEKDADTLAAMGLCGTTNPGGASKPGQAIKWQQEHTDTLAGAEVIIVPDVDAVGLSDRRRVALQLIDAGCKVRWIDLRKAANMPPKGDITDLAEMVGTEQARTMLAALVAAAPLCLPEDLEDDDVRRQRVIDIVANHIPGYTIKDGCFAKWDKEGDGRALCTFVAYPAYAVTTDNGVTQRGEYIIHAWDSEGRRLPDARVPYAEFGGQMRWLESAWPMRVNVATGNTVRDNIRYAMTEVGRGLTKHVSKYLHTGWREIGGKSCYLYQGGAIGADDVHVDLGPGNLTRYRLAPDAGVSWADISEVDAMLESLKITSCMPAWVHIPCTALCFLTPLREILERIGIGPRFLIYLYGRTGSGKSVTASLMLNYFARFDGSSFPASFAGSIGHIRQCAFALKDSLLVVDDYFPATNAQQKKRMEQMAQELSRMFGDGVSRDILNADSTRRESTPPRSTCLMTGENLPDIGESGLERYYCIHMEEGNVPKNDNLTDVQLKASKGYLRKTMRGYIEWLLPQLDALPDMLHEHYVGYRARAQRELKGGHARTPGNVAHLMLGYEMYLRYQMHVLSMGEDPETLRKLIDNAWVSIIRNVTAQRQDVSETNPAQMYLDTLQELVINGTATVKDLDDLDRIASAPPKGMIGYKDSRYYYLLPDVSFTLVCEQCRRKGQEFPGGRLAMMQRLREDGQCCPDKDGKPTKGKSINGRTKRYLWIPVHIFDGNPSPALVEQMTMAVGDPDNPWE